MMLLACVGSISIRAQTNVTLTATTSPAAAQPGITTVFVTGSSFPSGTIAAADVTLTIQPVTTGAGPTVSTAAASVVTVAGTMRRVAFTVPGSFSVVSPTPYRVTLAGRTTAGTAFVSSNAASLTINPPPAITSLTPSSAAPSSTTTIAIATSYTNFVQGATRASFGPGIAVGGAAAGAYGPVTVTSPTTATAQLTVSADASAGFHHVSVRTGVQEASVDNVFSVPAATPTNRPPLANAGSGYAGMPGQQVQFDGSQSSDPDGDPLTFTWQFGDGQTGSGPMPAHAYASAGQYLVTLTVDDGRGGQNSATATAQITRPNGKPTAHATGPTSVTAGTLAAFRGTDSTDPDGDALTFSWDFADGTPKSTEANPSHTFANTGSFVVSLTVTDPFGASDTASVTTVVSPANRTPIAVVGGPYSGQTGTAITFDGSASSDPDNDPLSYLWDFGDNTPKSTQAKPSHTYASTGQYLVTLTVSDGRGGEATGTTSAQVSHPNGKPTARASGPSTGNTGASLAFRGADSTDPDGDPLTYLWDFGDGTAKSTQPNPSHTFAQAGPYAVSLAVTDPFGASDTVTVSVSVTVPNHNPTAVPGGPYSGQSGTAISFDGSASSDPDGDALTYLWGFGDGATSSAAKAAHAYPAGGNYNVRLTVTDTHGASNTATVVAAVTGANQPPTANAGGPYSGEAGVAVAMDGSASSDPDGTSLTFSWDFGDGSPQGSGAKPLHAYAAAGTYSVTLTVADPGGLSSTATTATTLTASVDRVPPVVTLTGAKQALPGSQVMMTAEATDNIAVSSVAIDVNGADPVSFAVGPYQRLVSVPDVAAPGSEIHVHAVATDPSGNQGSAAATITIVAQPDTSKPTVTLSVPPQAAPGASIVVTADAADNAAVAGVDFTANTTPIGSSSAEPYQVQFVVPPDTPIGAVLTFMAQANDLAGNHAQATATLTVVGTPDNAPPTVSLNAPATAVSGTAIKVAATAADDSGVASVAFLVAGAHVGTRVAQPYEVTYTVPASLLPGTQLHVEAHALDGVALEAVASADITVVAPSEGVLTGAVFDDAIGLPVAGATVSLAGKDARGVAYSQTTTTDGRGHYLLNATEGQGTVSVTKDGWTTLDRVVTIQRGAALHVTDARLTSAGLLSSAIGAAAGGTISGPALPFLAVWQRDLVTLDDPFVIAQAASAPTVALTLTAGSLAADATLSLTAISRQGLAGLLPVGWTPVAVVDVGPHGAPFAAPASLTIPLPLKLSAGTPLAIAQYDDAARGWRAVALTTVEESTTALTASIQSAGQFAWLLADVVPTAPPQPVVGELLPGVDPALVPADATAIVDPQPRIIFYKPGVKSDVRGRVTTSAPLSSGAIARTRILESYDFFSGAHMQLDPTLEDVVLYQVPGTDGKALVAGYPVAPSLTFEALSLQQGVITVELRAPEALQETVDLIPGGGGSVGAPSGERIDVGSGAAPGPLPVAIAGLTAAEIGVPAPDGFEIVGAVLLDFANVLTAPAAVSVPRATQVSADDLIVVARMQELIGRTRFVAIGLGSVSATAVTSITTLPGTGVTFDGIRAPGRYVFLRATGPLAFASGLVLGTDAVPFTGAVVSTAPTSTLVSVSQSGGRYIAPVAVGGATLTARNPITGDSDSGAANAATARQIVALDFSLVAHYPTVASVSPQNGAEGVPLSGPIVVTFSTPIDPATATQDSIKLTSAAGPVAGTREFSNSNTVVTFRSTQPLSANTAYTLTVTTAIADTFGRALTAPMATTFTSLNTNAPPPPPAGTITATIPTNGSTTVSVSQGAAGSKDTVVVRNVTRGTTTPISVVDPSVGFTVQVAAGPGDKLQVVIQSRAGAETVSDVPAFRTINADGSVSEVASSSGGRIWGPGQGENRVALDVPAGALPDGTIVTLKPIAESEFAYQLSTAEREIFSFAGGINVDLGGVRPSSYLNLSIPAGPDDTADGQWLVGQPVDVFGTTQLNTTDTARVIAGRITTASPPCPGVTGTGAYGFLKSRRELGVNYGTLNAAVAQLVADVSYPPALLAVGFALPFMQLGLEQSQRFCIPSLTGRVTVTENFVRLAVASDALVSSDRELIAKNTTRTTEYHFPHDVVEYTFTADGQEADKFDVFLKDTSGNEQWFLFFRQDTGTAGSVTLRIHNDQVLAADQKVHVVDTTTQTEFTASLTGGRRDFEIDGAPDDTYTVEIVGNNGSSRSVGSGGFDVAAPVNAVVIRLNVDKIHVPLAGVRIVNRTRDSETTISVDSASVKVNVPGGPTDAYTLQAVDVDGAVRSIAFTVVPTTFGTGNLVVRARPGTIDPSAAELAAVNADSDGDGYLDGYEIAAGTNPFDPTSYPNKDSDGDGCSDTYERSRGNDPFDALDHPASCPAPIANPSQDPNNAHVNGAGRTSVTLTDNTTDTSTVIPPTAISGGGFAFPLTASPTDSFSLEVLYDDGKQESVDIPTARITVRNRLTGDIIRTISTNAPAKGDLLSLGPISDDVGSPVLTGGPPQLDRVDPGAPLTFTFSEAVNPTSVTTSTMIVERQDSSGSWTKVDGEIRLSADQRSATFEPTTALSLGDRFRVRFNGVTDLAGNALLAQEVPFSTFAPKRICPTIQPNCVSSVLTYDPGNDQFRRVQDLAILQKTVVQNNQTVVRTNLVGVTQGSSALDLGGSQLVTFDVTDTGNPLALGKTSLGRQQQRLTLLRNVTLATGPLDESGGLTGSFSGDLAVTTQYNNYGSYINIANLNNLANPGAGFAGGQAAAKTITRNPVTLSGNPADHSAHGTYEALGYARGIATLPYQGGYMSYAALSDFGIAMVDIGHNTPELFPDNRYREPVYSGDYYDVVAIADRLVAANRTDHKLEWFDPNLSPLGELSLPDGPRRIVYVEDFQSDQNGDGIIGPDETRNLAFVAADTCGDASTACTYGVDIVDMTDVDAPTIVGRIPMPGSIHGLDVDGPHQRMYVTTDCGTSPRCLQAFLVVDISKPDAIGIAPANLIDHDSDPDHWDDRIVWHANFPDASLIRPPVSDGSYLFGVRVDRDRGVVYVGTAWGIDIWSVYDRCCDVGVDSTAKEPRPLIGSREERLAAERSALLQGIARGLQKASTACAGGTTLGSLLAQGKISILEQGSGACVWRRDCGPTYQPGLSDHDYEVFVPTSMMPNGNPNADVACLVQTLNGTFIDDASKEPVVFPIGNISIQFEDVTFFPMPREEFENARLNINPPTKTGGTDTTGDLGLGRQQLLLKWLLEGSYVEVPEYIQPTDNRNLLRGKDQGQILDQMRNGFFHGIHQVEGYEWALLQQLALLKSQALVRIKGASRPGTSLHNLFVKQLHDAGKAGIRATLAALVARESARDLVLRIADGYASNACFDVQASVAPDQWSRKKCTSFEEFVAGAAVEDYLSDFIPVFDVPQLLQIHRFFRIKSDLEMPASDADADNFIAGVVRFIARAQTKTQEVYDKSCGSDPTKWTLGDCAQRRTNVDNARTKIAAAMAKGSVHIVPSTFNLSFISAEQVQLSMYRVADPNTPANGTRVVGPKYVNVPTSARTFYDYESSLPPSDDDLTPADLNELDLSKENEPKKKLFVLGDGSGNNPYVPLNTGDGEPHVVAFTLDLPEDGSHVKRESNRRNNLAGFFYYVRAWQDDPLGVTTTWGDTDVTNAVVPPTGPVALPFPDPTGNVLKPDAECEEPPKLSLFQSANNDVIHFSVTNTSTEPLTAVRVCSNAANACTLVGSLAPGESQSLDIHFQLPPAASTISSVASVTAIDSDGNGVAIVATQQLLDVASPISIAMFDATQIGTLSEHPFSRFLIAHTGTGDPELMKGTTTDGTEKALRIVVTGLKPLTSFDASLADTGAIHTTDGIGELMTGDGQQRGVALSLLSDAAGQAELYYNSPSVFMRDSRRRDDFYLKQRQVKLTVYQSNTGTSTNTISLIRPPVFLVHGLFGTIHVWGCFQPLVPVAPPSGAVATFLTDIRNELNGVDLGLSDCLFDKSAQYYEPREGFDGRFELFNVGTPNGSARFAEGMLRLENDIKLSLMNYRKGYAIGKVDLVGHSMGGVLSKKMTNEDVLAQKAVRKLIVLNSPLIGSEIADFVVAQRDNLVPVKLNPNAVDWLWAQGDPSATFKASYKVDLCNIGIKLLGLTPKFNLFGGGIDDLQTPGKVAPPINVPTHHITTWTSVIGGALLPDLAYSSEVKTVWGILGSYCNVTPEVDTIEATKQAKNVADIVKVALSLFGGFKASSGEFLSPDVAEGFMKALKGALGKAYKEEVLQKDPTPIFGTQQNDRIVALPSQLGGMTNSADFDTLTNIYGKTDHQAAKITPDITPDACITIGVNGPEIRGGPTVPDLNFDSEPDVTCRVIELLEADPKGPLFKR